MSQENVEIVQRMYDGWATGDFRTGTEDLDQHVVFVIRDEFPEFGVFSGLAGVETYMRRLLESWERLTIEAKHIQAVGDTVLTRVLQHGKGRASGIEVDDSYYMLFTLRGGKIVRIEAVRDEADALETVGLSEWAMSQENVEVVRSIYENWERGDYSSVDWQHPEIEFSIADGPAPGRWIGAAGIREGWGEFLTAWERFHHRADEYREIDNERVLVLARFGGRGKTSGLEIEQMGTKGAVLFHVSGGKVTRGVLYFDRERAFADLRLKE